MWVSTLSRSISSRFSLLPVDIANLQDRNTGSFAGDEWGETDTRFLYGALNALSLLHLTSVVDVPKAVAYVQACANFDGGYGTSPGAESHAGQIFTCVAALAIADRLDLVDSERLGGWLSERQLDNGGLNGRPEKMADVCYSWWVLSSLAMIGKRHWVNGEKLVRFILECQVNALPTYTCTLLTWKRTRWMVASLIGQVIWLMFFIPSSALLVSVSLGFQILKRSIQSSQSDWTGTESSMLIGALAVCHERLLGVHSQSNRFNHLQFRGVSAVLDSCSRCLL